MKKIIISLSLLYISSAQAYINQPLQNKCGIVIHKAYAAFAVNEYTCASGKFLPANAIGCEACPVEHTCNGGTFKFNPTHSQGIVYNLLTQKATDSCAENIGHKVYAVFTPNILTLNWDYKDGRTEQTTCEYGRGIELPPLPVRQGYKFMGWRVKQPE